MSRPWFLTGHEIREPCVFNISRQLTPAEALLFQDLQVALESTILDFDMLPAVNDGDSGCRGKTRCHSCFSETAHGVSRLVFAAKAPYRGFYAGEATTKPPRSHAVSAGLTSRMPYARGMVRLTQRVRQQIKDGLKKVYLVFCDLSKVLCGCAALRIAARWRQRSYIPALNGGVLRTVR